MFKYVGEYYHIKRAIAGFEQLLPNIQLWKIRFRYTDSLRGNFETNALNLPVRSTEPKCFDAFDENTTRTRSNIGDTKRTVLRRAKR